LGYPAQDGELQMLNDRLRGEPFESLQPVMDAAMLAKLQALAGQVAVKPDVQRYMTDIVRATRKHEAVLLGASPRGSVALMRASQSVALLSGKNFVTPDHVKRIATAVLAHRLVLKNANEAAAADQVIAAVLEQVAVPVATPT